MCIHACMYVCVCISLSLYIYIYLSIYIHIYIYIYLSLYTYIYIYIYIYVYSRFYSPPPTQRGWSIEAFVSLLAQLQSENHFQEVVVYRISLSIDTTCSHWNSGPAIMYSILWYDIHTTVYTIHTLYIYIYVCIYIYIHICSILYIILCYWIRAPLSRSGRLTSDRLLASGCAAGSRSTSERPH